MTEETSEKQTVPPPEPPQETLIDYKDKYMRVLAEQENARRRLTKERQESVGFAIQNVIADFLQPIDQMETALACAENMSDEVKNWALGFKMILNQFKDVLANNGVRPFTSLNTHFDPHLHEAVEVIITNDHPEGFVIEESVKGYKMGERVIRPARVKVAKAPNTVIKEEENTYDSIT